MYHAAALGGRRLARPARWLCYCGIVHEGRPAPCGVCGAEDSCLATRDLDAGPVRAARLCVRCDGLPPETIRAKLFARRLRLTPPAPRR